MPERKIGCVVLLNVSPVATQVQLAVGRNVAIFAADERLINFNLTVKFAAGLVILHGKPDAIDHEPCRLLRDL